jgi:hypothetical protein
VVTYIQICAWWCLLIRLHLNANDNPHISFTAIECILENKKVDQGDWILVYYTEIFIIIFWLQCCDKNLYQWSCVLGVRVLDFLAKDWFSSVRASVDFSTHLPYPSFLTNSDPYQKLSVILSCYMTGPFWQPPSSAISSYHMNKMGNPTQWKFSQKMCF